MAGTSMNDIKARMKSIGSTMQITKAMELVATSKLRKAKENAEKTKPFSEALESTASRLALLCPDDLPYISPSSSSAHLYIVIAGDRGLSGGYNSNVIKLCRSISSDSDVFLPIGKKAFDAYSSRKTALFTNECINVADVNVSGSLRLGQLICKEYSEGKISGVTLVYTEFVSMMVQKPQSKTLLPLSSPDKRSCDTTISDTDLYAILDSVIPDYVGGMIYSAACQACASEQSARRNAMNSANKNAQEMIEGLSLHYNRARQAVITQEITEIVSGYEAL